MYHCGFAAELLEALAELSVVDDHDPESSEPLNALEESALLVCKEGEVVDFVAAAMVDVVRVDGFAAATD